MFNHLPKLRFTQALQVVLVAGKQFRANIRFLSVLTAVLDRKYFCQHRKQFLMFHNVQRTAAVIVFLINSNYQNFPAHYLFANQYLGTSI